MRWLCLVSIKVYQFLSVMAQKEDLKSKSSWHPKQPLNLWMTVNVGLCRSILVSTNCKTLRGWWHIVNSEISKSRRTEWLPFSLRQLSLSQSPGEVVSLPILLIIKALAEPNFQLAYPPSAITSLRLHHEEDVQPLQLNELGTSKGSLATSLKGTVTISLMLSCFDKRDQSLFLLAAIAHIFKHLFCLFWLFFHNSP